MKYYMIVYWSDEGEGWYIHWYGTSKRQGKTEYERINRSYPLVKLLQVKALAECVS